MLESFDYYRGWTNCGGRVVFHYNDTLDVDFDSEGIIPLSTHAVTLFYSNGEVASVKKLQGDYLDY